MLLRMLYICISREVLTIIIYHQLQQPEFYLKKLFTQFYKLKSLWISYQLLPKRRKIKQKIIKQIIIKNKLCWFFAILMQYSSTALPIICIQMTKLNKINRLENSMWDILCLIWVNQSIFMWVGLIFFTCLTIALISWLTCVSLLVKHGIFQSNHQLQITYTMLQINIYEIIVMRSKPNQWGWAIIYLEIFIQISLTTTIQHGYLN